MPSATECQSSNGSTTRKTAKTTPNLPLVSIPIPAILTMMRTSTTYSHSQSHHSRQQVHHLCSQDNPHANHPIRPDHPDLLMPSRWALRHLKHMRRQASALLKWLPYRPMSCMSTLSFLRCALGATRVQGSHVASQAESHITRCPFTHHSSHYITFPKSYMGHCSPSGLFSHLLFSYMRSLCTLGRLL